MNRWVGENFLVSEAMILATAKKIVGSCRKMRRSKTS